MKNLFFSVLFLFSFFSQAQFVEEKPARKDTAYTIPMVTVSYAYQWAGQELTDRFGSNHNIGASFMVKTKNKWIYGLKGNFIWGENVTDQNILKGISTSTDEVIDDNGLLTEVYLGERGSSFFLFGGKMISVLAPNKNSGFIFYGGPGILQHKISMKFKDELASLTDEHKKGYDRFSMGFAINGFAGYLFLSKNRLLNFFGGFDYTVGWTKSLRKYNYATQQHDNNTYTNSLFGIRVGWIIRLNKRQSQEYYYD